MEDIELKYLKSLAIQYPTISSATTEIINLKSILNLPKGTEHFISDIHGAYEQMSHVLRNGSGAVKRKIQEEFGDSLSMLDKRELATIIYYPEEKLDKMASCTNQEYLRDWYKVIIHRLILMARRVSSKYTRSKVRKAIPKEHVYIIEELLTEKAEILDKEAYYNEIISTIIELGYAPCIIRVLSDLIKRLVIDHLHVIGDIYDRGNRAYDVINELMNYHSIDIQWGNHDVLWIGAAAGQEACIANAVRNSVRYGNLDILEEDYGINMLPLAHFAMEVYKNDECSCFKIKSNGTGATWTTSEMHKKIHKAITIIQFKLEGQIIKRRKEFAMDDRLLLDKIDIENKTVKIGNKEYKLLDNNFPTIDWNDPYKLTKEEEEVIRKLKLGFIKCDKLQQHIRFLMNKGSLYLIYNSNLLYHGCVPLTKDGKLRKVNVAGKSYSGRALYDILESYIRKGYYLPKKSNLDEEKSLATDLIWFVWSSENSPVFGKKKMATFERYFLDDKEVQSESKDSYYKLMENPDVVNMILKEFSLEDSDSHIINGHMPVKAKSGESPAHCDGKLLIIDGGFCEAYQGQTGVAGYTLIYNSYGLRMVAHEPFKSVEFAVNNESDIFSELVVVEYADRRKKVADTDIGKAIMGRMKDLRDLLDAYRLGIIREEFEGK